MYLWLFRFFFGPAAAWGAALGNVIRDIATNKLNAASIPGFFGNLLVGYIPYKLLSAISSEKPDLKTLKKFGLFAGAAVLACTVCGVIIGWGLDWLGWAPFMPTTLLIVLSDAFWAVLAGSAVLALTYGYFSRRKLLYTDILNIASPKIRWSKTRSIAVLAFAACTIASFSLATAFTLTPMLLLPFAAVSVGGAVVACK